MPVDISKPPAEIIKDATDDINSAFPTENDKTNAGNQFKDALTNNEDVRQKAIEEVRQLATTIRNIRAGFIEVAGTLVGFDGAEFKDKNGNIIKLGPKWAPYIKQFDETLQFSLEQATNAKTLIDSMTAVFEIVKVEDGEALRDELLNYMDILKKKEEESLLVKDKFQELADNVKLFVAEIDLALEKAAEAIKIELDRAKGQLDQLNTDLKNINEKIQSLGIATASTLAVGAAATVVAIATMNPVAMFTAISSFFSAIGTGIALKKAMDERDGIINNIKAKEREIEQLNARQELLEKYKKELDKTKEIVNGVSDQIAVIANIWQKMNLDMHALAEDLDNNIGPDTRITKFFLAKLTVSKELLDHLGTVLSIYVAETTAAGK